jgi:chemotaxis protein CheX
MFNNVEPFIEASKYVINEVTGMDFSVNRIYAKESPYHIKDVAVLFGVFGEIKGQAILSMDSSLAKKISASMIGAGEITELDELAKSALAEIGNMVFGHTANMFYNKGVKFDITPPSVLAGSQLRFSSDKMSVTCLEYLFENGEIMELNIAYSEA